MQQLGIQSDVSKTGMKKILAADIGGTNSRFAHFNVEEGGKLTLAGVKWLPTKDADSFNSLIEQLKSSDFSLPPDQADIAVFAVAGPVEHGSYSAPPYISWDIDISDAQKKLGIKNSVLINDFVAQAYACRSPVGKASREIIQGQIVTDAAVAVIGAGTGLGKAVLLPDGNGGFLAAPSEGGHAYFPFISGQECEFQRFLMKKLSEKHITGNLVVSGKGLSHIHWFLKEEYLKPEDVAKTFSTESDTLAWAARFYGRVCRDYALLTLSLGGLYIAGGLAAKIPELVTHEEFKREFHSSSTMGHLLRKIPVFLITDENSGLWGAAFLGLQKLRLQKERS